MAKFKVGDVVVPSEEHHDRIFHNTIQAHEAGKKLVVFEIHTDNAMILSIDGRKNGFYSDMRYYELMQTEDEKMLDSL